MRHSYLLALLTPLTLSLVSWPAQASQVFPEAVKAAVPGLPCVPQCTLCHQANPGVPPANKPFAIKLKTGSVVQPQNIESLKAALAKLKTAGAASDADGDMAGDYDELALGSDPNSNEVGASLCDTSPLYGCGASTIARRPAEESMDSAAAIAAAFSS